MRSDEQIKITQLYNLTLKSQAFLGYRVLKFNRKYIFIYISDIRKIDLTFKTEDTINLTLSKIQQVSKMRLNIHILNSNWWL